MLSKIKRRHVYLFLLFAIGACTILYFNHSQPKFHRVLQRRMADYYLSDQLFPHHDIIFLDIHDTVLVDPDGEVMKRFRDTSFYVFQQDPIVYDSAGVKKTRQDSMELHFYPIEKQFVRFIGPIWNHLPPARFSPDQRVNIDIRQAN